LHKHIFFLLSLTLNVPGKCTPRQALNQNGNRAISPPKFSKRVYLLGTATSLYLFAPPKNQLVVAPPLWGISTPVWDPCTRDTRTPL